MRLEEVLGADLYEQVKAKIDDANANQPDKLKQVRFVDLSEGNYVSKDKFDSTVGRMNQQVTDLQAQVTQRDTDLTDLQARLTAAQADATKLTEAQQALTALQSKYDTDKQSYADRLAKQSYEFAVREKANSLHFSSGSAKRAFIADAIAKEFKQDGDNLLGYEEFVNNYKQSDPSAFAVETPPEPTTPPPQITMPTGTKPNPDTSGFSFHFNGVRSAPSEE